MFWTFPLPPGCHERGCQSAQLTLHKIAACCISWRGAQRAAFGVPTTASALRGIHRSPTAKRQSPCLLPGADQRLLTCTSLLLSTSSREFSAEEALKVSRRALPAGPSRRRSVGRVARTDASRPRRSEWQPQLHRRRREPRRHRPLGSQVHRRCHQGAGGGGGSQPGDRYRAPGQRTPGPAAAAGRAEVPLLDARKAHVVHPRPSLAPAPRGLEATRPGSSSSALCHQSRVLRSRCRGCLRPRRAAAGDPLSAPPAAGRAGRRARRAGRLWPALLIPSLLQLLAILIAYEAGRITADFTTSSRVVNVGASTYEWFPRLLHSRFACEIGLEIRRFKQPMALMCPK
jgi:hypothetical protein